ncbi:MAG: type I methionyl aminopeptidase [Nitrospira sp.]|nr:type I methionyl aminopeptidase [Nitrospira sp.]
MPVVKTEEQVEKMRLSAALLSRCLDALVCLAKPGKSGKELDTIAEEFIRDHGAIPAFKNYGGGMSLSPFPASICFSRNQVLVHGVPKEEDILQEGDIVTIDCGLSLDGWFADAARLFGVGVIAEDDTSLIDASEKALQAGVVVCMAGNKLGDVCNAIQRSIGKSPFFNVYQFCGHAIGNAMHESPQVPNFGKPGTGIVLEPGMIFCLEPMLKKTKTELGVLPDHWTIVTLDQTRASHIEHMVLITENDPEVLTL